MEQGEEEQGRSDIIAKIVLRAGRRRGVCGYVVKRKQDRGHIRGVFADSF